MHLAVIRPFLWYFHANILSTPAPFYHHQHTHEVCVTRNYRYYLYNGSNVVTTIPNTMLYLVTATPQNKLGMCDFPETT